MQRLHTSTHGPSRPSSRRKSPAILNPAHFSAGAAQTQNWPYDPTRNSMTTATTNGQYYQSYSYPIQAAESAYYTQTIISSQSYQDYNSNPNNTQLYQPTGEPYHSATNQWPQQSYYDPSVEPSLSSSSTHQHAAAAASTSASQLSSSKTRVEASKSIASTSRPRKGIVPDMRSKMNRFRVTDMASTIPAESPLTYQPQPPIVGRKRKERSPTPDSIRAEAPSKDAKKRETQKVKSQKSRDKLNSDIAELAERLPSHSRAPGAMSSKMNIVRAATYIDEQNARIGRLENEVSRSHSEADQWKATQVQLTSRMLNLQTENERLAYVNEFQQYISLKKTGRSES